MFNVALAGLEAAGQMEGWNQGLATSSWGSPQSSHCNPAAVDFLKLPNCFFFLSHIPLNFFFLAKERKIMGVISDTL